MMLLCIICNVMYAVGEPATMEGIENSMLSIIDCYYM